MNFKYNFIFYASIMIGAKALPQSGYNDSVQYSSQIIRIEQQLLDAIPAADTALWNRYLDDSYFIITEDGTGYNKKEFLSTFGPLPKGFSGYIKVINPHFIFKNNIATVHYVADEYEIIFGQNVHTTYSTLNTYIKTDTSWKIVASQVFEIPQLPVAVKINNSILKKYTGIYKLTDSITCIISLENDTLFIQKKDRGREPLFAETENVFFRKKDTRGRKIFVKDENQNMLMNERRNGQDVVWKRIKNL